METITLQVRQPDVYAEVAKATDYTGSKLIDTDASARERILAADDDLSELGRFWQEAATAADEELKEMLIESGTRTLQGGEKAYECRLEVSVAFDKALRASVESALRSFFIASIIGQWFKFANKGEAADYFSQAGEQIAAAERLLYSRRRPSVPH